MLIKRDTGALMTDRETNTQEGQVRPGKIQAESSVVMMQRIVKAKETMMPVTALPEDHTLMRGNLTEAGQIGMREAVGMIQEQVLLQSLPILILKREIMTMVMYQRRITGF